MNPFTVWTELAFKLWGFGKPSKDTPEKKVAVAVIPASDAPSKPKRAKTKPRIKRKAKRARR